MTTTNEPTQKTVQPPPADDPPKKPAFVTRTGIRVWGNVDLARTRIIKMLLDLEQTAPAEGTEQARGRG